MIPIVRGETLTYRQQELTVSTPVRELNDLGEASRPLAQGIASTRNWA